MPLNVDQLLLTRTLTGKRSGVILWGDRSSGRCSLNRVAVQRRIRTNQTLVALHLRSVCLPNDALHSLKCHPLPCMLLKLRLCADSTRTRFRHFFAAYTVSQIGAYPIRDCANLCFRYSILPILPFLAILRICKLRVFNIGWSSPTLSAITY